MKPKDAVVIPKGAFIKEHKHLIKLLNRPDKKALKKEAKSQKKELMNFMKKY